MSNLAVRQGNSREVHQELQTNQSMSNSWWKSPVLWILFGTVLATSVVTLDAWGNITGKDSPPLAPSAATENEAPEPKMPQISPYVPVMGI